jgi:hypothetical protein
MAVLDDVMGMGAWERPRCACGLGEPAKWAGCCSSLRFVLLGDLEFEFSRLLNHKGRH